LQALCAYYGPFDFDLAEEEEAVEGATEEPVAT
jgi:hypothetical protein